MPVTLFWIKFAVIIILQGLVGILGFFLFPIAYFLRHKAGIEGKRNPLWFLLNYTEDSDWGLSHYKNKPPSKTFWNALKWYVRNPAWNFKMLFRPKWRAGEVDHFEHVKFTLQRNELVNDWTWANKDLRIFGTNHLYYKIEGTTYGRYSYASRSGMLREIQMGAAGNRYKLRIKGPIILIGFIIIFCMLIVYFSKYIYL